MVIILHLLLIIILTMGSRVFPRWVRPWARASDTYYHLLVADRLKENRFHIPSRLDGLLIAWPFNYPPLFHYILARFSRLTRERLEPYLGGIFDTLQTLALYTFVYYLSGRPEFSPYEIDRAGTAWLASLVFITCPLLFGVAVGPRAFMGSPRPLAELLTSLSLMAAGLFYATGLTTWAGAAIFLACLAVLTGKFALQVLVAFSLVMALFLKSLFFLVLPLLTVAGAFVISRGHYWKVLRGQLAHSHFYATTLIHRYAGVRNRGSFKALKTLIQDFRHLPVKLFRFLYLDNQYTALIIKTPWLFLWLYLAVRNWSLISGNEVMWYLLAWVLSSLAAFLLTSNRGFLFLGEAERYVEYSMPALAAMIALTLSRHGAAGILWVFWGIVSFNLVQLLLNYLVFIKNYSLADERQTLELIHFLNHGKKGRHALLCIPTNYLAYRLAYATPHTMVSLGGTPAYHKDIFDELFNKQVGWPNDNLPLIISKYKIDFIICWKRKLPRAQKMGISYDFSAFPVSFENPGYIVYKADCHQTSI